MTASHQTECCASHTGSSDQCLKVCEAASGKGRLRGRTYHSLFILVTIAVCLLRPKNDNIYLIKPFRKRGLIIKALTFFAGSVLINRQYRQRHLNWLTWNFIEVLWDSADHYTKNDTYYTDLSYTTKFRTFFHLPIMTSLAQGLTASLCAESTDFSGTKSEYMEFCVYSNQNLCWQNVSIYSVWSRMSKRYVLTEIMISFWSKRYMHYKRVITYVDWIHSDIPIWHYDKRH